MNISTLSNFDNTAWVDGNDKIKDTHTALGIVRAWKMLKTQLWSLSFAYME